MSAADTELLTSLAAEGITASRSQLERWRQHGLLARPIVTRGGFRGSAVEPVGDSSVEACLILAEASGRGRDWRRAGLAIFDAGLPLSDSALRSCSQWIIDRGLHRRIRNHWLEAEQSGLLRHVDVEDDLAAVGKSAADRILADRYLQPYVGAVRRTLKPYHPTASHDQLKEALETCLTYQARDVVFEGLPELELQVLAVAGRELAFDEALLPVLPSALSECARSITQAEARTSALLALVAGEVGQELPSPIGLPLLGHATWLATGFRLQLTGSASISLSQSHLLKVEAEIESLEQR